MEKLVTWNAEIKSLRETVASQQVELDSLRTEVNTLKLTTDSYLFVRSRSFVTFLRDNMNKFSRSDAKIIQEENYAAHAEDSIVNAMMFKKRLRTDMKIFVTLYGITWSDVFEYGMCLLRL